MIMMKPRIGLLALLLFIAGRAVSADWNQVKTFYDLMNVTSISFADVNNGWVSGYPRNHRSERPTSIILHTSNGGKDWMNQQTAPEKQILQLLFKDRWNGWRLDYDAIHRTTDGGNAWIEGKLNLSKANTNYRSNSNISFTKMYFLDLRHGWAVDLSGLLLKTSDGGLNWQIIRIPEDVWNTRALLFTDTLHGWIGGTTSGEKKVVIRTTNGGESWEVGQELERGGYPEAVFFSDSLHGWFSVRESAPYRTSNGGLNWTRYDNKDFGYRYEIGFSDSRNGWANVAASYSSNQAWLYRTSDGGNNWFPVSFVNNPPYRYTIERIVFVDNKNGWGSGNYGAGGIFHTSDGGKTWINQLSDPYDHQHYSAAIVGKQAWLAGSRGKIHHTSNNGLSWDAYIDSEMRIFYKVTFWNEKLGWAAGEKGALLHTSNGGEKWWAVVVDSTLSFYNLCFVSDKVGWAVGGVYDNGCIYNTCDGGDSWQRQLTVPEASLTGVTFTDSKNGWVSGNHGTILHTDDGGKEWISQNSATAENLCNISFPDRDNGWAVGSTTILHTTNRGNTWVPQDHDANVDFVDIGFLNATTGWVIGDQGTILHTSDGGVRWQRQTLDVPTAELQGISVTKSGKAWVVGNNGIILEYDANK